MLVLFSSAWYTGTPMKVEYHYRIARGLRWLAAAIIAAIFLLFYIASVLTLSVYPATASGHAPENDYSGVLLGGATAVLCIAGLCCATLAWGHFGRAADAFEYVEEDPDTKSTPPLPVSPSAT
jgi:hypothetical protein